MPSTVKKIAQEPIDLASADAAGAPTAATDATHVDASTTPTDIASAGAHGSSLLAAPADHTHKGLTSIHSDANANINGDARLVSGSGITLTQAGNDITVAASGGMVNKITYGEDGEKSNVGMTEEVLWQKIVNFDDAPGTNVQARLSAEVAALTGTGTFNLRVGGTSRTADGTVRAVITAAASSFGVQTNQGSAFANPTGAQYVKICAVNSGAGGKNLIRDASVSIG